MNIRIVLRKFMILILTSIVCLFSMVSFAISCPIKNCQEVITINGEVVSSDDKYIHLQQLCNDNTVCRYCRRSQESCGVLKIYYKEYIDNVVDDSKYSRISSIINSTSNSKIELMVDGSQVLQSHISESSSTSCGENASYIESTSGCECNTGYSGDGQTCTNIDDCASNPCQNNGTCSDGVDSYNCACVAGYSGTNCETNIDNCASNPCQNNGTCSDGVDSYSCACVAGYSGTNCETNIDNCASNPCQNNGTCSDGVDSYSCACVSGYSGTNCETNIDNCASNPCQNNGTCSDGVDSYSCACVAGYSGTNCETDIDNCASNPCQNNGTCSDGVDSYSCACVAGYSGTNCETNIDNCASNPCQNNGTCSDGVDSYSCACEDGYSGANCETTDGCAEGEIALGDEICYRLTTPYLDKNAVCYADDLTNHESNVNLTACAQKCEGFTGCKGIVWNTNDTCGLRGPISGCTGVTNPQNLNNNGWYQYQYVECRSDSDCAGSTSGNNCNPNGECVSTCVNDNHCDSGFNCDKGACFKNCNNENLVDSGDDLCSYQKTSPLDGKQSVCYGNDTGSAIVNSKQNCAKACREFSEAGNNCKGFVWNTVSNGCAFRSYIADCTAATNPQGQSNWEQYQIIECQSSDDCFGSQECETTNNQCMGYGLSQFSIFTRPDGRYGLKVNDIDTTGGHVQNYLGCKLENEKVACYGKDVGQNNCWKIIHNLNGSLLTGWQQSGAATYCDTKIPFDIYGGVLPLCNEVIGKYVKITNPASYLHLGELEVHSGGINVALEGSATQTSTYSNNALYAANKVIDGNPSTINHTAFVGQWLEIELLESLPIEKVVVYNRPDCCQDRLLNYTIEIFDSNHNLVFSSGPLPTPDLSTNVANINICGG